jgi:hypothetical protein
MSAGAPIPPNPSYQNVPPPSYQNVPPPQPPPSSGNTVLKIVLIVVGVIVLFGVIAAGVVGYGVYKVSHAIRKNANGDVSVSLPTGTITTGKSANLSAADLGVAPYPGAISTNDGSMNMKTPTGSMVTSVFTSTDSSDKVVDFYKEKLGDQASIVQTGNGTMLSAGERDKDSVMVTVTPQGNLTKIAIIHVTQKKS